MVASLPAVSYGYHLAADDHLFVYGDSRYTPEAEVAAVEVVVVKKTHLNRVLHDLVLGNMESYALALVSVWDSWARVLTKLDLSAYL